jgi:hypothetical protein
MVALQNIAIQTLARIRFAYKRASMPGRGERLCPVCEQAGQAIELLFGSGLFRFRECLTVFRHARNIICIRTK